ncbi:MAG: VPLPA-CTERM-specific exosortase XrtD, partial [Pseudomonadota bacterium]
VTYGFIIWVGGMVLAMFGLRRGWIFWPSVLHLVFMLPLPHFIYWHVSTWLQMVSSEIGVGIIVFLGVPVFLEGNIIDLGVYKLQVAEACSGLRYLFPIMSFSYVFGVLYTGPFWHKVVLLLSAAPITVLMNSVRIGIIGYMVDNFGIEHAEGFLHAFEGWVIFITCVAMLFGLAWALKRLAGDKRHLSDTLDMNFDNVLPQAGRIRAVPATGALGAATALALVAAIGWYGVPNRAAAEIPRDPLVVFPAQLGEWSGKQSFLDPNIERVLGADDYMSSSYVSPTERSAIDLFVAYYHRQNEGTGIHSPEICIPAGGWEVSAWRQASVEVATLGDGTEIEVNRAIIQKGLRRQLVYFWFEQRGRRMTSDYLVKAMTVWDAVMEGRTDGALVRLITPLAPGEDEASGDARLQGFMELSMPHLARFVPN